MFGTLRPGCGSHCADKSYRSNFCGACHNLAEWGKSWSLITGFDFAFLHLLLVALEDGAEQLAPCTALPWKKLPVRSASPTGGAWLKAFYLLLIREKLRDDIQDGERLKGTLGLKIVQGRVSQAETIIDDSEFPNHILYQLNLNQREVESRAEAVLEHLYEPTSRLLGEAFGHLATLAQRPEAEIGLRQLGQGLGAVIYLKDAVEDLVLDRRKGRFNAVLHTGLTVPHIHRVMERELRRARTGLDSLQLGKDRASIEQVLHNLSPTKPAAGPSPLRRRKQRGFLECLTCGCEQVLCQACCECGAMGGCDCCVCTFSEAAKRGPGQGSIMTAAPLPESKLHCPACGMNLRTNVVSQVVIDECEHCLGIWLDKGELEQINAGALPQRFLQKRTTFKPLRPEGSRPCPHCAELMMVNRVRGISIDVCSKCQGIWLDQGELNKLL